ncbi:MAG: endonuclease/exonuclease/phosphatase family protein [Patescibacteria group bacterium]|nr:endonuclease/exonuclease/phosphatase family protein [Patescibacteria group bacterium]
MALSVLTFNTFFNRGFFEVEKVIDKFNPDILCLQEFLIDEKNIKKIEAKNYSLADYHNSFIKSGRIYGVITFYKKNRLRLKATEFVEPKNNPSEYLFNLIKIFFKNKNQPKTILKTTLIEKETKKEVDIYNLHLFIVGSNLARVSTLKKIIKEKSQKNKRVIICGDFNYYPIQRKKLEVMMNDFNFKEATKNISQTINPNKKGAMKEYSFLQKLFFPIFKLFEKTLKIDYVFYKNLTHIKTLRIENHFSDHYPIISFFKI